MRRRTDSKVLHIVCETKGEAYAQFYSTTRRFLDGPDCRAVRLI
jgi:hypothetical protein